MLTYGSMPIQASTSTRTATSYTSPAVLMAVFSKLTFLAGNDSIKAATTLFKVTRFNDPTHATSTFLEDFKFVSQAVAFMNRKDSYKAPHICLLNGDDSKVEVAGSVRLIEVFFVLAEKTSLQRAQETLTTSGFWACQKSKQTMEAAIQALRQAVDTAIKYRKYLDEQAGISRP